jgi:hypothetical protein
MFPTKSIVTLDITCCSAPPNIAVALERSTIVTRVFTSAMLTAGQKFARIQYNLAVFAGVPSILALAATAAIIAAPIWPAHLGRATRCSRYRFLQLIN